MARISEDSLRLYFREAGRLPLLDRDAEVRLGQAMEAARRASAEMDHAVSEAERAELQRWIREGEEACALFVRSNLRLVVSLAGRYQGHGLPLADLVQEGNLGLMHAVAKYDWRRGFRFSSYATWWIHNAISRAIEHSARVVRLPAHMQRELRLLRREADDFEMRHGRRPDTEELAVLSAIPSGRVAEVLSHQSLPLSLDEPVNDQAALTRGDLVRDPSADPSAARDSAVAMLNSVERLLGHLDRREREILRLRFGLDGGVAHTRVDVAERCQLSPERIRQIEARALVKLGRLMTRAEIDDLMSA